MLLLEPEITLFISLLPAALSPSLPLSLPHIHFPLSILCLLSYVFLFHYVLLSLFNSLLLLGSTGVREGLEHQGKRGDIAFWHASYYFPFNFTAWRGMCDFLRPYISSSHPFSLSSCHNVLQVAKALLAEQIALYLPISSFSIHLLTVLFVQQKWATVQQHQGIEEKRLGTRRQWAAAIIH